MSKKGLRFSDFDILAWFWALTVILNGSMETLNLKTR